VSSTSAAIAGQLIVSGFPGPELSPLTERALAAGHRAGCILFKRNLPTTESTRSLTARIREAAAHASPLPPLVAIDEEGGRVSRLPASEPKLPPMRLLGAVGDAGLVLDAGRAIGARLVELGFNLDFSPVLDVDSNPKNPVIGDRSFGASPGLVAELGLAFARGLEASGVLSCGKHFPGHGDTDKDSHLELPIVRHARDRLDRIELAPFRAAARAKLDAIMTAHVVVEAIDPSVPATFSRAALVDLLRGELGFEGVVISDDLEMRAVAATSSPEDSAVRAIGAGCDLLLVCSDEAAADRVHARLAQEIDASPAFAARARESAARVTRMRDRAGRLEGEARAAGRAPLDVPSVLARIEEALSGATVVP